MKYSININQLALSRLSDKLDTVDGSILDWAISFIASGNCLSTRIDGVEYYWLSYQKCIDDMPLLKVKHKDSIKKRMVLLAECGLLVPSMKNQELGRSYFKLGPNVEQLFFTPREENQTLGKIFPTPSGNSSLPPREKFPYDYSINDNTIKDKEGDAIAPPQPLLTSGERILKDYLI